MNLSNVLSRFLSNAITSLRYGGRFSHTVNPSHKIKYQKILLKKRLFYVVFFLILLQLWRSMCNQVRTRRLDRRTARRCKVSERHRMIKRLRWRPVRRATANNSNRKSDFVILTATMGGRTWAFWRRDSRKWKMAFWSTRPTLTSSSTRTTKNTTVTIITTEPSIMDKCQNILFIHGICTLCKKNIIFILLFCFIFQIWTQLVLINFQLTSNFSYDWKFCISRTI